MWCGCRELNDSFCASWTDKWQHYNASTREWNLFGHEVSVAIEKALRKGIHLYVSFFFPSTAHSLTFNYDRDVHNVGQEIRRPETHADELQIHGMQVQRPQRQMDCDKNTETGPLRQHSQRSRSTCDQPIGREESAPRRR